MLIPFLRPLFKKSQIFLTGWNRTMFAPLKLMPSPLGCAFWKKPSQQQLSMEQMPQPSYSPSRNCPVQELVLPQPSYLSSLKQPSQAMLPLAEYSNPKPFLRDRLISPSQTTVLLSMMMLQPSMEWPEICSALMVQSPMRISCMDCSSSGGKEGEGSIFLGLDCYQLRGAPMFTKKFNITNYAQQTCKHPMKP